MSFLTPLYMLGLAAISLPILLHLIRRTPRGVQAFSSLMFITPTPPRLTRRSRIDQLLLLLLRAAIIALLAFAFARPFLRQAASTDMAQMANRRAIVLIDTSGSMRRDGVWRRVERELEDILADAGPGDLLALSSFAGSPRKWTRFEEAAALPLEGRRTLIRERFQQIRPGWGESALDEALIQAADELDALADRGADEGAPSTLRELIVISDLQAGSHIDALQSYQWPPSVRVVLRRVESPRKGNASLRVLVSSDPSEDEEELRVRVSNSQDATEQQLEISWRGESDQVLLRPVSVSVPPGESRVARLPRLPPGTSATHLALTGDAQAFDNRFHVATASPSPQSIVYLGREAADDPDRMLYYLKRAVQTDPYQPVEVIQVEQQAVTALNSQTPRMVVVTSPLPETVEPAVQRYLRRGGTCLLVLTRPADLAIVRALTGVDPGNAEEAPVNDYVLWSEIDFQAPLFDTFAGPLYNDFTKIHFWKYRRLSLDENSGFRVLVRYDNDDPAMLRALVQEGRLYLLTSGWHPDESQLARSSKFVPLMARLMGREHAAHLLGHLVDQTYRFRRAANDVDVSVVKPNAAIVPLSSDATKFSDTDQPGRYRLRQGDREQLFAVNVAAAETRTSPLDVVQLEQRGVLMGNGKSYQQQLEKLRQMRDVQLEAKQNVWQWLIVAVLILLIVETVIANRSPMPSATATA